MLRSLYTAATGMEAQQLKMDVIADNLANVGTTAFKRTRADFEDLLAETIRGVAAPDPRGGSDPTPLQVGLGVRTGSTVRSFSPGDRQATQNQLDLAIDGAGFFKVQRQNGDIAYTRAGNFRVDATGRLTNQNGEVVEPGISIPQDATQISIQPTGLVSATVPGKIDPVELGTIDLATFQNQAGLSRLGNNLYAETTASGPPVQGKPGDAGFGSLSQGYLEGANVKAVEEMIDMISTQRSYELNSKVIQTADQMLQRLATLR